MTTETDEPTEAKGPIRRIADPLTDFLHDEAAGGIALLIATVAALLIEVQRRIADPEIELPRPDRVVAVAGEIVEHRLHPIAAGLLMGKALGIAGAAFLGIRLGWGTLPDGVRRGQVWGLAALGGIGFTVSLFIAQLAYDDPEVVSIAKIGIFAGSVVSAAVGAGLLLRLSRR